MQPEASDCTFTLKITENKILQAEVIKNQAGVTFGTRVCLSRRMLLGTSDPKGVIPHNVCFALMALNLSNYQNLDINEISFYFNYLDCHYVLIVIIFYI